MTVPALTDYWSAVIFHIYLLEQLELNGIFFFIAEPRRFKIIFFENCKVYKKLFKQLSKGL